MTTHTPNPVTIQQSFLKLCGILPSEWGNPISVIPNEETKARASRERKETAIAVDVRPQNLAFVPPTVQPSGRLSLPMPVSF